VRRLGAFRIVIDSLMFRSGTFTSKGSRSLTFVGYNSRGRVLVSSGITHQLNKPLAVPSATSLTDLE
jgi:hypothetical protein